MQGRLHTKTTADEKKVPIDRNPISIEPSFISVRLCCVAFHRVRLIHLSERDASHTVCKMGAEIADCPDQATCGGGSILACDFPLERKVDGSACVLTAEAKEEVNAVVEALR